MKPRFLYLMLTLLSAWPAELRAIEIKGRVVAVDEEVVKVKTDSEFHPAVGDKVEFSFDIPGVVETASVGSGTVTGLDGDLVVVKMEKNNRLVAKDHLATMKSDRPTKKGGPRRRDVAVDEGEPIPPAPERSIRATGPAFKGRPENLVECFAVSSDGKYLLAAYAVGEVGDAKNSVDVRVLLWDVKSRRLLPCFKEIPHAIEQVAFSTDGTRAILLDVRGRLRRWDLESAKEIGIPVALLRQGDGESIEAAALSPDGDLVAMVRETTDPSDSVQIFDATTGKVRVELEKITGAVSCPTLSADGKLLMAVDNSTLGVWDAKTGRLLSRSEPRTRNESFHQAVFSSDGRYAVIEAESIEKKDAEGAAEEEPSPAIADGPLKQLVHGLRLVDVKTGRRVQRFDGNKQALYNWAISPDGRSVAAVDGKTLLMWDAASGKLTGQHEFDSPAGDLKFAPDGQAIAAAVAGNSISLLTISK